MNTPCANLPESITWAITGLIVVVRPERGDIVSKEYATFGRVY